MPEDVNKRGATHDKGRRKRGNTCELRARRKSMHPAIGPIRAFLYARSASESQNAPTAKVDEQLQRLRRHAQDCAYIITGEACDVAQSGLSMSRPGLTLVLRQSTCRPLTFDVLLATDRFRLARGIGLFNAIVSDLNSAAIEIEFIEQEASPTAFLKPSSLENCHEED